jgi:DNA polymerase-3 subunit gamma/tau
MLQQDLAGAMLLYDDINRKGFEGDLVINGFAEFIRNVLVCKDDKAAVLLEVMESFKDKYLDASRRVSASVLISALNILNEAEINYKSARNKRLHVELVLIKLCYLQQAIELSSDNSIGKKKLVDSAKPIAFKAIAPIASRQVITESLSKGLTNAPKTGARLIIETSPAEKLRVREKVSAGDYSTAMQEMTSAKPAPELKISALNKIRSKYQTNGNSAADQVDEPLQQEELQTAWSLYVQKLKEAKNPAAQSLELATLEIKEAHSFEVITSNNIEQKFIEQERNNLFSFLKEQLKNRLLQFNVTIQERPEQHQKLEAPLSSKEQFYKMIEQYPLVKELKDRLGLDLDY